MRYSEIFESETQELKFSDLPRYQDLISSDNIFIANKKLTSLSGSPDIVHGEFNCGNNKLVSLAGGPKEVKSHFSCYNNPLTNLVGAPEKLGGEFFAGESNRPITLLGLTTREMIGRFIIHGEVTGLIELFNVKGITQVILYDLDINIHEIIDRHIKKGVRGKLAFQADMIDSGFKEYL
jgi:hypothetical protein